MYKIVGGDQKEYGPVTAEQLREWILQNRANASTIISFQGGPWKPLSTFPEFSDLVRTGTASPQGATSPIGTYNAPNLFDGKKSNWLGVSSLILGIVSIFPCCCSCPLIGVVGIVLGIIGLIQINKEPQVYTTSRNIPIIGIVLCVIAIILAISMYRSPLFEKQFRKFQQEFERVR
jgi:hypothetical protein